MVLPEGFIPIFKEYCGHCYEFEPEVEKEIICDASGFKKCINAIGCVHGGRCAEMFERIKDVSK